MSDDFPRTLDRLLGGAALDEEAAEAIMDQALDGQLGPERLAALLTAMRARPVSADELVGFARSMRRHAHQIATDGPSLDNCGTGGASVKTFNISTAAAFVLSAAGIQVAKHGNRSVTRPSGSADVLERAGADLSLGPDGCQRVLDDAGIAFLFAPTFHPAMKYAGPVRQALGIKTVFNLLGPLCNPAGASMQVIGVYDRGLIEPMAEALARLGCKRGAVLHGEPGTDEATPLGPVHIAWIHDGSAEEPHTIEPSDVGITPCSANEIAPVAAEDAPTVLQAILAGEDLGPRHEAVAFNAGIALVVAGHARDVREGVQQAKDILASGSGIGKWNAFIEATQG